MERIDAGSEVHSSSIHEDLKTRTLYEMVTAWTEQPWDGTQYYRITEELWNSVDASGLMDGPYGDSVTLLEMCIVDSTETLQAGQLTEEQAVDGLKKLLENEDFVEGAKIIEVHIKTNPVCRISNLTGLHRSGKGLPFPEWNRRKTLLVSLSFVSWLVLYVVLVGFGVWEPTQLITWTIITGVSGVFFYYVRRRLYNFRFRRMFWIVGFGCFFSMPLTIAWLSLLSWLATPFVSWLATPSLPLVLRLMIFGPVYIIPPLLGGGLIAEKLGKQRDYMPYM
ncbi:MAG: hypothetical protein ACTSR9_17485 [Candidatus Thorarchaeota archaeon]